MPAIDAMPLLRRLWARLRPGGRQVRPRLLMRDRELMVNWYPGSSDRLVLVFTGKHGGRGRLGYLEFTKVSQGGDSNHVLFITDLKRSWYSRPGLRARVTALVQGFIAGHGIAQVSAIGNSMGGYGAILFCDHLPISRVAAFVPQILLTPEVIDAPNWVVERAAITDQVERDLVPIMRNSPARFTLVYGDQDHDDRRHLAHLPRADNIDVLVLPGRDHGVARWLKQQGRLDHLAGAMINGDPAGVADFRARICPVPVPKLPMHHDARSRT